MEITKTLVYILAGLIVCIPLAAKLVETVRDSVQKENWSRLVSLVIAYMTEAETKISGGATRKEWVMGMIRASADTLEYSITESDWAKIGTMIDELAKMAETVNTNHMEVIAE